MIAAAPARVVRHVLDAVFLIGVVLKGLDGLAELIVGVPLLFLPPTALRSFVDRATSGEVLEDPHDLIAHLLLQGVSRLHGHDGLLLGIYLTVHGVVKVAIVVALIVGATRVYPWAIAALGVLAVLQIVDLCIRPTIGVGLLTVLDLVIIALTWREWRERRSLRQTWAATRDWILRRVP